MTSLTLVIVCIVISIVISILVSSIIANYTTKIFFECLDRRTDLMLQTYQETTTEIMRKAGLLK